MNIETNVQTIVAIVRSQDEIVLHGLAISETIKWSYVVHEEGKKHEKRLGFWLNLTRFQTTPNDPLPVVQTSRTRVILSIGIVISGHYRIF